MISSRPARRISVLVLATALGMAASRPAHAQQRPPPSPRPAAGKPDASGLFYRYSLGLDGNWARGTTDRLLLNVRADGQLTTRLWGVYVEPRWTFAETNGRNTDSEYYVRSLGFLYPRDRFYGFAAGVFERSLRRKTDHRLAGGIGVGTNVIRTDDVELLFAVGGLYESTDYYLADFEDRPEEMSEVRNVVRAMARSGGHVRFAGIAQLFFDAYFLPAADDLDDYRILCKASLELLLVGSPRSGAQLSARALLDYTHEQVVVVGTSKDELMLSFGVVVRRD